MTPLRVSVIGCGSYYGYGVSYERGQVAASLEALGHTVRFHNIHINEQRTDPVLAEVDEFKPDLCVFIPHEYEVDPKKLRALGYPVLLLLADDTWRREFGLKVADHCDYVIGNAPDSVEAYGRKSIPFEWAVFEGVWVGPEMDRPYDMSFVAQLYGHRHSVIQMIRDNGINIFASGNMPVEAMATMMRRSKIGLNLSRTSQNELLQIKIRPFETGATGAMILTEYAPRMECSFVEGKEAVFFTTYDEMLDKARYYLAHDAEREAIAAAGKARVLKDHTLARRWDVIFKAVGLE